MKKNFKETTELLETLEIYFRERETVNDQFIIEVFAIAGLDVVFTKTTFKFEFVVTNTQFVSRMAWMPTNALNP